MDLGLSHRGSVLLLYAVCLVLAGMSLALSNTGQLYAFMGLAVVFGLGLFAIERLSDRTADIAATDDDGPTEARGD